MFHVLGAPACTVTFCARSPQRLSQQRGKEGWLLCPLLLMNPICVGGRGLVVVVSLDIILATSYFLSSFTVRSTERERGRPRKGTLLGWKKEGRRAVWQGYSQLLHCVATPVPTGGFDWINTSAFIQSVTRFHSLSFGNSIWLFG